MDGDGVVHVDSLPLRFRFESGKYFEQDYYYCFRFVVCDGNEGVFFLLFAEDGLACGCFRLIN